MVLADTEANRVDTLEEAEGQEVLEAADMVVKEKGVECSVATAEPPPNRELHSPLISRMLAAY